MFWPHPTLIQEFGGSLLSLPPSHMTSILLNSSMDLSGTDTGEVKCHHRPQQSEQGVTPLMVTDGFQQLTGTGKPEDSFPRETL